MRACIWALKYWSRPWSPTFHVLAAWVVWIRLLFTILSGGERDRATLTNGLETEKENGEHNQLIPYSPSAKIGDLQMKKKKSKIIKSMAHFTCKPEAHWSQVLLLLLLLFCLFLFLYSKGAKVQLKKNKETNPCLVDFSGITPVINLQIRMQIFATSITWIVSERANALQYHNFHLSMHKQQTFQV